MEQRQARIGAIAGKNWSKGRQARIGAEQRQARKGAKADENRS